MKLGVIARPEDRGLGIQTWETSRHLDCSVLVVDVGDDRHPRHFDRYPGALRVQWRGRGYVNRGVVRDWIAEQDVVFTAETFYDPSFTSWSARSRTATVCQLNPEFWVAGQQPTEWWSATGWRADCLPESTQVVPFPVATERFTPVEPHDGPTRWLHVAGHGAMWDRNGTQGLLDTLPLLSRPCVVTIAAQGDPPPIPAVGPGVEVQVVGPTDNYWDLYTGHDALVMPRRYGGLCLPVQEAMAAGLAVVMLDVDPNPTAWPVAAVEAWVGETARMYAGPIGVAHFSPPRLARMMDSYSYPELRVERQKLSRWWADVHSWDRKAPEWSERFARLAGRVAA